jgi:hypothetical protein
LALVDAAIAARMAGQAVDEWSEGGHRVAHMPLDRLLAWQLQLQNFVEQETNGCAMPVVDTDA